MDYAKQQQKLLRDTRRELKRLAALYGVSLMQQHVHANAQPFLLNYATSEAYRMQAEELVQHLGGRPLLIAASPADATHHNYYIACVMHILLKHISNDQPHADAHRPPLPLTQADGTGMYIERQQLVYSKLIDLLNKQQQQQQQHARMPIQMLERRLQSIERRLDEIEATAKS